MQIWRSLDEVPADLGRTVVTVGNFDGVHLGHQHVVGRAREVARDLGDLPVVVVTFDPHPMAVLRPEHAPLTLTTLETRAALLETAGADHLLVVPFNREVAAWSPERFVADVLVDALHARAVVVGANFRFGIQGRRRRRHAAPSSGATHDFEAVGIALDGGPQVWSSTYVRTCLVAGDVEGATEALGRPFTVRGEVVRGDQRGRELGYPTANVPTGTPGRRARRRGVRRLAAPCSTTRAGTLLPAAISVGTNPTFDGDAGPPGGVLRARPRRPRPVRRRGRGVLRGAHPRDDALRLRRGARRHHAPGRRAHPRATAGPLTGDAPG